MALSRNSSCNNGCSWLTYLFVIAIIAAAIFGGREQIKSWATKAFFDKESIEQVVKEYINSHPKDIIASLQKMQENEYEDMMKQAQALIKENLDDLQGKDHEIAPYAGNKNGDIIIAAFLDYRCGYCKSANASLKEIIKQDPNVKVLYKELPVLGPQSQKLSQMALAVYLIDNQKYVDFHNALMDSANVDDKSLDNILKNLNISKTVLTEMMKDARIKKELDSVANLAQKLNIRGTPAFVVDEMLIPGAIEANGMKELVGKARANKSGK